MSSLGKKWTRRDKKWTDEMTEFVKSVCPLREHGINSRKELAEEINKRFGRKFTDKAVCSHCYENGIQLGLCYSNSDVPRGSKHYQRYVWEQNHPGESAEGKTVIFMDGNNRNFDPNNLECVERGELSVMSAMGCTAESTREERELFLLRARLICAKSKILGSKEATRLRNKMNYEKKKDDPEKRMAEIMADPVRHQEHLAKQREYREKNRERLNQWTAKRRQWIKENDLVRYQAMLDRCRKYKASRNKNKQSESKD